MVQWREGLGGRVMAWGGTSGMEKMTTEIWRRRGEESNGGRCNGEEGMGPTTEKTGGRR